MKSFGILSVFVVLLLLTFAPSALSQADPLPNTGTYFIVSVATKQAMQPNGPTPGQNVFLQEYNQSGMQKWAIKRKLDPKTKKPLNSYTIRLAGDAADLNLQPFPAPDHTCIVSSGTSNFSLAPIGGSFVIKSSQLNGDALYSAPVTDSNTEARFGPSDNSDKFKWDFLPAN